jgi:uridylate kinase
LKLSGEMLGGQSCRGLDSEGISFVAAEVAEAVGSGVQVAVVIGAGNLVRGAGPNRSPLAVSQQRLDGMGMLATAINAIALNDALQAIGIPATHMSALGAIPHAQPFDADRAIRDLDEGRVLLLSGGTGLPFFSTDTAAAVRALQLQAEALFKGTQVKGVYDRDPKTSPEACFLPAVPFSYALEHRLRFMDLPAIALCAQHRLPVIVFDAHEKRNLAAAIAGNLECSMVGPQ